MMNLNFDIETPKTCADCKFHFTDKKYDDHTWAMYCMICPDVEDTIQDGMTKRSSKCIGVVDDDGMTKRNSKCIDVVDDD